MKTRPGPGGLPPENATVYSVADIAKWAVPRGKLLTDAPINPHGNETVSVTGYVRLVKLSGDDCDLHIQLGQYPDKHVPQIIAEIPPSEIQTRKALASLLSVRIHAPNGRAIPFDGPRAVRLTVIGKPFDDASHWEKANPKIGNNHGRGVATLWVVHPAWRVIAAPQ